MSHFKYKLDFLFYTKWISILFLMINRSDTEICSLSRMTQAQLFPHLTKPHTHTLTHWLPQCGKCGQAIRLISGAHIGAFLRPDSSKLSNTNHPDWQLRAGKCRSFRSSLHKETPRLRPDPRARGLSPWGHFSTTPRPPLAPVVEISLVSKRHVLAHTHG